MRRYSNSEVQTFKRCHRKWWLTYVLRLKAKGEGGSGALWIGTMIDKMVSRYYEELGDENQTVAGAWQAALAQLQITVDEAISAGLVVDPLETELAYRMIEGYAEWLMEEGVDSHHVTVSVQEEMAIAVGPYHFIAKLDSLVRSEMTGRLWVVDTKTVGSLKDPQFGLDQNEQMLSYIIVASEKYGEDIEGGLFNMLRKVKRTSTAKPPFYGREEVRFNSKQRASFKLRLRIVLDDIDELEHRTTRRSLELASAMAYPTPKSDCSWDCQFQTICPMFDDGSRVEAAIAEWFEVVDDPYDEVYRPTT